MTEDARFEDGGEGPLRLRAYDADDLAVISALLQDAVFVRRDARWLRTERRFAILVNRFRWEDLQRAERSRRTFERVRSVVSIEDALQVRTSGLDEVDAETVLSVLSLAWLPAAEGTGTVEFTLAGAGAVRVVAEALEVILRDVTRPYRAPSGKAPRHE